MLVIAPLPEFPWDAPYCVMRSIRTGVDACVLPRSAVDERRNRTVAALERVAARHPTVRLLDPINLFCSSEQCRPNNGKTMFFSDTSHLSAAGAERLFKAFKSDFDWVFGASMLR